MVNNTMPQPESHMISLYFTPLQWETILDALERYGPYHGVDFIIDSIQSELRK